MSIAKNITGMAGARSYLPEGPYGTSGNFPFPSFAPGDVMEGELGAEYEFVFYPVTSSITHNQGDVVVWDNSGAAVDSATGSGAHPFGAKVGTMFFGGRRGELVGLVPAGNVWSYTFATPGVYGIWVQRSGISLCNIATVNAQTKPANTTAVAGQLNQPAAALAGSMGVNSLWSCPTSGTFSANTINGSAVLTGVSTNKFLEKGQTLSGTGIPNGAVLIDIQGSTVTMNVAATATNSSQTITAANNSTWGTTVNGSPVITGVTSIAGIYPNQTIAGTGVPGSTTIVSITGNAVGGYVITMSANASASGTVNLTTTVYWETFLQWPFIGSQN